MWYDESKVAQPQLFLIKVDSNGNDCPGAASNQILKRGIVGSGPGPWQDRKICLVIGKPIDPRSTVDWDFIYWKVVG